PAIAVLSLIVNSLIVRRSDRLSEMRARFQAETPLYSTSSSMADRDILGDARDYYVDAMTLDGAPIRIRAIRPDDQDRLHEHFTGLSRYICGADPRRAELAFAVLDEFQGHGIGALLLEHLRLIADANAVTEFEADVLGENRPMLEVFAHSGFETDRSFDSGVVHLHRSTNEMLKK